MVAGLVAKRVWLVAVAAMVFLSACSVEITRNADGSLGVTSVMTEESVQSELALALEDRDLRNLSVDLHSGAIAISAERPREDGSKTDEISFWVDLSVADGALTATVSDVRVNGKPWDGEGVERWNERIADRLERAASRRPNSTLISVTITEDDVTFVSRVETARSRR